MPYRGVLYLTWGNVDGLLKRSIDSLRKWHPDIPVHVERLPEESTYLDKARMRQYSPFETTAFLDVDTVVMGDLSFAFEKAEQHGLACCICEAPWARRYESLNGDTPEYNAGVLFFDNSKSKQVFEAWEACAKEIDSSVRFHDDYGELKTQPVNDQAGLAKAIEDTGFNPFILPLNWNFRPKWHRSFVGPIKIWHDYADPTDELIEHSKANHDARVMNVVYCHDEDESEPQVDKPRTQIACAMSVPRLGFQDNFFCWASALMPLGITPTKYSGAFWGQCLERVMEDQLDADWILTIDYDSVFTQQDVLNLIAIAEGNDHVDAVFPLQTGRMTNHPLLTMRDENGKAVCNVERSVFDKPLVECSSGHFGLTMIRTAALKKMEHPWFLSVPDSSGRWGPERQDDDVYFWRKWRSIGNKIHLASRVAIGHAELLITWPDINMEPIHQHPNHFWEGGKPEAVWK